MEEKWTQEDMGKVIFYNNKKGLEEIAAIVGIDKAPNTILAIEYPMHSKSRTYLLGLKKDKEKDNYLLLEEVGDWHYKKDVSKEEREEIDKISKSERRFSEEF